MKHEVLTRAIGELDDELIADAYAYKPRKRYALPRFLAAAACLVLVLAAALAMTRDTLPAEIKVEGAALSSIPIPISQPAAMALDARGSLSGPLSPMLTIESKSGEAVTVTVSDGVLTQPLYSLQEEFTSYTVSGSCADGSIKVKKSTTGVTLVLDGLTLTSENTAAITCGKSSEVTILVSNGTENSLSDTEQNNDDNYPENENAENAVIKCKDGSLVTLCGDGELTITANGKNGIKSGATTDEDGEASLTIRDLTLNIDAPVNDAINAEQLLNVESGTLTIDAYSSAGDGFDSNGDLTITGDTVIVWTANTADNEPLLSLIHI